MVLGQKYPDPITKLNRYRTHTSSTVFEYYIGQSGQRTKLVSTINGPIPLFTCKAVTQIT